MWKTTKTSFATATYEQVEASGPPSPPLGFARWTVSRAQVINNVHVQGEKEPVRVISRVDNPDENNKNQASHAYLLPGTLLKETLCGRIVQSQVLVKQADTDTNSNNQRCSNHPSYQRTDQWVAIKMDSRSNVRHLHHGTQAPSENPWKEVAALEMLGGGGNNESHHVVSLKEALVDDTYLYEILPYYTGGSLYEFMSHYPQGLPEEQARRYFYQVLQAIYYIHSRGVCHRDISTHNLMFKDESHNDLYLIDFGMCLRVPHSYPDDDVTEDVTDIFAGTVRRILHTQSHCGKLRFMAPEMYQMQNFDSLAVDLWSAAVVLFVLLTGRQPYEKPNGQADADFYDLMDARFYWDPKSVAQIYSWGHVVSEKAVDLLKNMFQLRPQDRLTLAQVMEHSWMKMMPSLGS